MGLGLILRRELLERKYLVFILLNLIDYFLTRILINMGDTEANPLWRAFPLEIKLVLAISVGIVLKSNTIVLKWLNIGMLMIVVWNLFCLGVSLWA